jgi:hypothetical protein
MSKGIPIKADQSGYVYLRREVLQAVGLPLKQEFPLCIQLERASFTVWSPLFSGYQPKAEEAVHRKTLDQFQKFVLPVDIRRALDIRLPCQLVCFPEENRILFRKAALTCHFCHRRMEPLFKDLDLCPDCIRMIASLKLPEI